MVSLRKDGLSSGTSKGVPDKSALLGKEKKPFIKPSVEVVLLDSVANDIVVMSPAIDWGEWYD